MPKDIDLSQLSNFLQERASEINENVEVAIKLCGEKIRSDIQYSMAHTPRDMSKSYFTNNKKKAHHPSMPGNPPAPDTGNLRQSIRYEVNRNGNEIYGIVGSTQKNPDYAVYTEYGTKNMAPRPWLRPAMLKNNDFIRQNISKAIQKTLSGGN